eukprot:3679285-Rhodomonas_salina.2
MFGADVRACAVVSCLNYTRHLLKEDQVYVSDKQVLCFRRASWNRVDVCSRHRLPRQLAIFSDASPVVCSTSCA